MQEDEALDTGVDEETRVPPQSVDLVPDARNPARMLGVDPFTQHPCHDQPDVPGRLTPPLLIQQKDVGLQMKRQGDGLGLSRVERNGNAGTEGGMVTRSQPSEIAERMLWDAE